MRIFQIVTLSELGGAQTIVAHLANTLSHTHEVTVFAGEGDNKLFRLLNLRVKHFKVSTLVQKASPLNDIRTLFFLSSCASAISPISSISIHQKPEPWEG